VDVPEERQADILQRLGFAVDMCSRAGGSPDFPLLGPRLPGALDRHHPLLAPRRGGRGGYRRGSDPGGRPGPGALDPAAPRPRRRSARPRPPSSCSNAASAAPRPRAGSTRRSPGASSRRARPPRSAAAPGSSPTRSARI
jgi:hypothetical protein